MLISAKWHDTFFFSDNSYLLNKTQKESAMSMRLFKRNTDLKVNNLLWKESNSKLILQIFLKKKHHLIFFKYMCIFSDCWFMTVKNICIPKRWIMYRNEFLNLIITHIFVLLTTYQKLIIWRNCKGFRYLDQSFFPIISVD